MYTYRADVLRVVDGDTFIAKVDLGFGSTLEEVPFRVMGLDTCETTRRLRKGVKVSAEEVVIGKEAKARAKSLLDGQRVTIRTHRDSQGVYGRYLADITLPDGRDFATIMKPFDRHERGFVLMKEG